MLNEVLSAELATSEDPSFAEKLEVGVLATVASAEEDMI